MKSYTSLSRSCFRLVIVETVGGVDVVVSVDCLFVIGGWVYVIGGRSVVIVFGATTRFEYEFIKLFWFVQVYVMTSTVDYLKYNNTKRNLRCLKSLFEKKKIFDFLACYTTFIKN